MHDTRTLTSYTPVLSHMWRS